MTVDRSYSSYESIRNYKDRGMMKWQSFTNESLSEAEGTFKTYRPIIQEKSEDEMLQILGLAYNQQIDIHIYYEYQNQLIECQGKISEINVDYIMLKDNKGYTTIKTKSLRDIKR